MRFFLELWEKGRSSPNASLFSEDRPTGVMGAWTRDAERIASNGRPAVAFLWDRKDRTIERMETGSAVIEVSYLGKDRES